MIINAIKIFSLERAMRMKRIQYDL